MDNFTPALNLPSRKQKGLIKMFGGISIPWYYTKEVVKEGTPVKLSATTSELLVTAAVNGTDAAKVIGLTLQETYSDAAFEQLAGYHFANDTRQRTDGNPIGVLGGTGYAMTTNYSGTTAWGTQAYVGASGVMAVSGNSGDKLPVYFEGAGTDGATPVRIRFEFPLAVQ